MRSLGLKTWTRTRLVPWSLYVSQWASWLRCQYGKLEIWVRIPARAQKKCFSQKLSFFYSVLGGLVAQAVRRSPLTAGVPSSRLGPSMWVSWWTKRGLGRFFHGVPPVFPYHKFHSTILHTHLIHFVSFHPPLWWCVRRGRPAPLLLADL